MAGGKLATNNNKIIVTRHNELGLAKTCCCNEYQQARFCSDSSLANLWKLRSELPPGVDEPILLRDADGICYFFDLDLDLPSQTHGPLFGKGTDITHPDGCTDIRCTCPGGIGAPCFICDIGPFGGCPLCHTRTPRQMTMLVDNVLFINSCVNCTFFCFGPGGCGLPSGSMGETDYNGGLGVTWNATYTLTQTGGDACVWEAMITLPVTTLIYSDTDCNTLIYSGNTALARATATGAGGFHIVVYDPAFPISYWDDSLPRTGAGCGCLCDPQEAGCGSGAQCYGPTSGGGIGLEACDGNGCV